MNMGEIDFPATATSSFDKYLFINLRFLDADDELV
jgi:hypothetical protein